MGYVALLLGLAVAGSVIVWSSRRSMQTSYLRAERTRIEEILEECVLVRNDMEQLLAEFSRQSSELVKQLEKQSPRIDIQNENRLGIQAPTPSRNNHIAFPERYRGVDQLLNKGFDAREIAENLEIGIGEIQLLLNLKNRAYQERHPSE